MTFSTSRTRPAIGRALGATLFLLGLACAVESGSPDGAGSRDGPDGGPRDGGRGSDGGGESDGAGGGRGDTGGAGSGGAGGATGSGGAGGDGAAGGVGGAVTGGSAGIGGAGGSGTGRDGSAGGAGTMDAAGPDGPIDADAGIDAADTRTDTSDSDAISGDAGGSSPDSDAPPPTACPPPTAPTRPRFAGYYGIYAEQVSSPNPAGKDTPLAKLPAYVNVVNVAFMRPDASYAAGSFKLAGTGVEPAYWAVANSGQILRDAVTELHRKSPDTEVMISVGGATYFNWTAFNPDAVAAFVGDMGFDGVDLDYEPGDAGVHCTQSMSKVSCLSDKPFVDLVTRMRAALPRPKLLSIAAWSVGAYGEDQWVNAQPPSEFRGMALALLRSSSGPAIDRVNVMSFDAGPTYDPAEALAAYQNYFCGPVLMGVEVPPEAWGGHVYTLAEVRALADAVIARKGGGMMMWELHKPGGGTDSNPSAQMMATALCEKLSLGGCSDPLVR